MIGRRRLENIERCLDVVRRENIPGDLKDRDCQLPPLFSVVRMLWKEGAELEFTFVSAMEKGRALGWGLPEGIVADLGIARQFEGGPHAAVQRFITERSGQHRVATEFRDF